jgi:hypothetical protein
MKSIWCFVLLVLVLSATGICTAKVPDLVGNWTGSHEGYHKGEGTVEQPEEGVINLIIMEQKDRLFTGNLTYRMVNGAEGVEGFAGAIGSDNKTLYIAEFGEGYDLGSIISDDEMDLIYLRDGETAEVSVERLYRIRE